MNVPRYPKLKVESYWKIIKSTPHYIEYFPDYKQSKQSLREYLFNLLHTVNPQLVEDKTMECHRYRKIQENSKDGDLIEIMLYILEEIMNSNYHSSKAHLFKLMLTKRGEQCSRWRKKAASHSIEKEKSSRVFLK